MLCEEHLALYTVDTADHVTKQSKGLNQILQLDFGIPAHH